MNFIEELRWRGMIQDHTPDFEAALSEEEMPIAYVGFDPTAPSLTIGNLVPIMLLTHWQRAGYKPIVLMGGATGRIGDPSGKDKERTLLGLDTLDHNLEHQKNQMRKLLDFDCGENSAVIVNNYDFYKDMNLLTFLRDVGKNMTVNYMLAKDSVKNRITTGISFTEFSYQLIQGYDFQHLYTTEGCKFQMGGSDQWGNIVSGSELVRRSLGKKVHALTCPLLTKADGKKFGKSEAGNIWLGAERTSPYQFYQFWLNADDRDMPKFIRTFSLKTRAEIEAIEAEHAEAPHLRIAQKALGEELTIRIHSKEALDAAMMASEVMFNKKMKKETLMSLSAEALDAVSNEIPSFVIAKADLEGGLNIMDFLANTKVAESKGAARRAIKGNAISVNKEKIKSHEAVVTADNLIHGKYIMVENGKKNKYMILSE